jgi:hypothetical protein
VSIRKLGIGGLATVLWVAVMGALALPAGANQLPDNRSYELVTNPLEDEGASVFEVAEVNNGDGGIGDRTALPFRAAADGSAVVYISDPTANGGGKLAPGDGQENIARASAGGGWKAGSIQPTGLANPAYQGFSSDLSVGVLGSNEALSSSVPPSYGVLYSHTLSEGAYNPLFTTTPPNRISEEFGGLNVLNLGIESQGDEPVYAGASADMTRLLFEANDALTEQAAQDPPSREQNYLYESVEGQPRLVNVLPDGTLATNATFGSISYTNDLEVNQPDFSHVISEDGSRVFWSSLTTEGGPEAPNDRAEALYVRENGTTTVQIDASQGPGVSGGGRFWTASPSGSRVLFTDESKLTTNSTAEPGEPDLYLCELPEGQGQPCKLTDLTADGNLGEHANVQGVMGTSEDLSYVYFVADGKLAAGAEHQECISGGPLAGAGEIRASRCNLYVTHEGEPPKFIAKLSGVDDQSAAGKSTVAGDWHGDLGFRTAQVTPDGHTLAFLSNQRLTSYENAGQHEIYVYDADSGGLSCVSCNPTGSPVPILPTGSEVITTTFPVSYNNTYALRVLSEDGNRVFFTSEEGLVRQDKNELGDVYEWERPASASEPEPSDSCTTSAASFNEVDGGCLSVLSGGTSSDQSFFLDASANGDDAFFITRAQLTPQDQSDVFNVYDARVDAPAPVSPPACSGTGCQGVPGEPPIFATPSSVTFGGVGNFPPAAPAVVKPKAKAKPVKCKKGQVKKKSKCVKKAKTKAKNPAKGRK